MAVRFTHLLSPKWVVDSTPFLIVLSLSSNNSSKQEKSLIFYAILFISLPSLFFKTQSIELYNHLFLRLMYHLKTENGD
jgi:hypothetical protein